MSRYSVSELRAALELAEWLAEKGLVATTDPTVEVARDCAGALWVGLAGHIYPVDAADFDRG